LASPGLEGAARQQWPPALADAPVHHPEVSPGGRPKSGMDVVTVQVTYSNPYTAAGRPAVFHMRSVDNIAALKELIRENLRVLVQEQRILTSAFGQELHDNTTLWELRTQPGEPVSVTLVPAPINLLVLSGGSGGSGHTRLCLFDAERGEPLHELTEPKDNVLAAVVDWNHHRGLSAGWESTIRLWDLAGGKTLRELQGHNACGVFCLAADWVAQKAVSGGQDCTLRIWDLNSCMLVQTLVGHAQPIFCVSMEVNARRVLSGSQDRTLRLWNLDCCETMQELSGHSGTVFCLAVDWSWMRALSGSWDCTLRLWDLSTGETLQELRYHTNAVFSCAMDWNSQQAVSGGSDNAICVWDLKQGLPTRHLYGHGDTVTCFEAEWSTNRLLSGSLDGTLRLWDVESGENLQTLQGRTGDVRCVQARWLSGANTTQAVPQVAVPNALVPR